MNTTKYKTKQLDELLDYLKSTKGNHLIVSDIINHFKSKDIKIGTTTIYRLLEKLVNEGIVNKYYIDNQTSACFEYIGHNHKESSCYHLKCENCNKLIHLHCNEIDDLQHHIFNHHKFKLNPIKTVFYGLCDDCTKKLGR